jgi:hypothetical protein
MAKHERTDPMGLTRPLPRTTLPMVAAPAPPAPASSEDLTATREARAASSPEEPEKEEAGAPSKPALSKAEIRSIFRELSDGLGEPSSRAAVPESEIAQYAEPHRLRAKNLTPVPEPAILVRRSVIDEVVRPRAGSTTMRTAALGGSARARVGAAVAGAAVVCAVGALVVFQRQPGAPAVTPAPSSAAAFVQAAAPPATAIATNATSPSAPSDPAPAPSPSPTGGQDVTAQARNEVVPVAPPTGSAAPARPRPRFKALQAASPPAPSASGTALPYGSFVNQERK